MALAAAEKLQTDHKLAETAMEQIETKLQRRLAEMLSAQAEIKSLKQMLQERDDELQTFGKTASAREAELQAAKQDLREALEQRNQQLSGAQQALQQRDEQLFEAKRALKENVVAMKRELCAHGVALTGNISRAEEEIQRLHTAVDEVGAQQARETAMAQLKTAALERECLMQTEETRRAQEKAEALEARLGQAQADMAKLSEEVQVEVMGGVRRDSAHQIAVTRLQALLDEAQVAKLAAVHDAETLRQRLS